MDKYKFVSVDFVNDDNVKGNEYWYLCEDDRVKAGSVVTAPLGRHNRLQQGIVRQVKFGDENSSPFNFEYIKKIDGFVR